MEVKFIPKGITDRQLADLYLNVVRRMNKYSCHHQALLRVLLLKHKAPSEKEVSKIMNSAAFQKIFYEGIDKIFQAAAAEEGVQVKIEASHENEAQG